MADIDYQSDFFKQLFAAALQGAVARSDATPSTTAMNLAEDAWMVHSRGNQRQQMKEYALRPGTPPQLQVADLEPQA